MAREDCDVVGEGEERIADGFEELLGVASGEVGAADRAGKEGVSGEEKGLLREIEADAALGVAGGVEDGACQAGDGDDLAVFEAGVWRGDFRGGNAEPSSLNIHHPDQGQVVLVVEDGRSGEALEALGSGDVVDVGVGDDDLLDRELMLFEGTDDAGDVVAGIDDDGFAGGFVAKDGAVALERADDENFVDHAF